MDKLYRFELGFDENPQDIGIFRGLMDTGISEKMSNKLLAPFTNLLLPELNDLLARFWFTEEGVYEFLPDIVKIRDALQKRGWQIFCKAIPDDAETRRYAMYQDAFQVALTQAPDAELFRFDIRKFKKFMPKKG